MRYDLVGLLVVCLSISSCERPAGVAPRERGDWHIVKCGLTWDATIADPRRWALEQFADGPIEGPDASEWARLVLQGGLVEERRDLDGDGAEELFLRQGVPARVWTFLVFAPVEGGWRYEGSFDAGAMRVLPKDGDNRPRILVYEACGGTTVSSRHTPRTAGGSSAWQAKGWRSATDRPRRTTAAWRNSSGREGFDLGAPNPGAKQPEPR